MPPLHLKNLSDHAKIALKAAKEGRLSPGERLRVFKRFIKIEEHRIKLRHQGGAGGLEIATARAELLDIVLRAVFHGALKQRDLTANLSLVAVGGYGRGTMNPCSDVDLLFLVPRASHRLPKPLEEVVHEVLYLLWDVGFKVGHAVRSISECVQQSRIDLEAKTALMDARRVAGDRSLFADFRKKFAIELKRGQEAFFSQRREDLRSRHTKFSRTVFLQEPNVKEGCGGMRDYQNILWVIRVKRGWTSLEKLVEGRLLTRTALKEIEDAYDFLHRVRNELHYQAGRGSDQLTLRLQGVVSTDFRYPQRSILRRTEAFMRDYYRHTRNLYQHSTSIMEIFQIEEENNRETGLTSFLTLRSKKREEFDGFIAREGRIYPTNAEIFKEDANRIMRLFQHCQVRNLRLSPPIRKLVKKHWGDIDRPFRYNKLNREVFEGILSRKGDVARTLRQMHRVGFLGRYLPEFGALDCLVQHEFFHRYTADEHTLRFIEAIDALVESDDPRLQLYRQLLIEIQDPPALYLAILLHDSGRSENVREHIDGSAMLAQRLCNRLQVRGSRRQLIMFLVDHHLTLWRYATTKNIEDPKVVAEFAALMRNTSRLDALLLFTYADSNATSPDAWTSWKETLLRQLHSSTRSFLTNGKERFNEIILLEREALQTQTLHAMGDEWKEEIDEHFSFMPASYFRFRSPRTIPVHVKAVKQFKEREAKSDGAFECSIQALDRADRGYTEVVVVSRDQPLFLEKVCCAIASEGINILSADFHTRVDGIVVDIFRVCTVDFAPVSDPKVRESVIQALYRLSEHEAYNSQEYLKPKRNLLRPREEGGIAFPVRVHVSNDLDPQNTIVEVQAIDRIGLLHDLFHAINECGLDTVHARICTEKGAALDTLYVTVPGGGQATDIELLETLQQRLEKVVHLP
ncbi:[protein-PII] uridylyltransferase [Haloferula luteola]|uniref:Bifunctional uridylyltransferase/uridylyl-removing enzyme n=1 Tax=Haloferula luteola TaxID=595692 RepID=A0A840VB68_9BACT|nr:[protein-PII] uridylyltransferase [Haloferula luteola]MBB5351049.1 [protein-PII] uridylyltransferase [Haloferula luteola]